jgi:hypothetical protein
MFHIHKWGKWKPVAGGCQQRFCLKCGKSKTILS